MSSIQRILTTTTEQINAGNLQAAEQGCNRILREDPCQPDALHLLGILVRRRGRPDLAVDYLRRAIQVNPKVPHYYNQLGEAYRAMGRLEEAITSYRQAIDLKPDFFEAHNNLGIVLQNQGRLEEAARCYQDTLELDPNCGPAHLNLGTLRQQEGKLAEAKDHYRQTLAIRPDVALAHQKLAEIFREEGNADAAIEEYQKSLAIDPSDSGAHLGLAMLLHNQNDLEGAKECYRQALALQPNIPVALNNLGILLYEEGSAQESQRCFLKVLELDPNYAEAHLNLGKIYMTEGDLEEAEARYRRSLALKPNSVVAYINLGDLFIQQNRTDEAFDLFREVLRLDPENAVAHQSLGMIHQKKSNFHEAKKCYEKALELDSTLHHSRYNLGCALHTLGELAETICVLERLPSDYSGNIEAKNLLCQTLMEFGDYERSEQMHQELGRLEPDNPIWDLRNDFLCPTIFSEPDEIHRYRETLMDRLEAMSRSDLDLSPKDLVDFGIRPSFNLQFHGLNDRALKERFGNFFDRFFPKYEPMGGSGIPRVGFVITRLQEKLFLKLFLGLFEHLSPGKIEPTIVCREEAKEFFRPKISSPALGYLVISSDIDAAAETIFQARFDVVFHWIVGTEPLNYFLPFYRLAPVQCTTLGMQITTGIPSMDYYYSSDLLETERAQEHYSERLYRAKDPPVHVRRLSLPRQVRSRDHLDLPEDRHIYLCAQQIGKFHPDFDEILAGILRADPEGEIVITRGKERISIDRLQERFRSHIPDVAGRIRFVPHQRGEDYTSLLLAADVLLDPIHFSGMNTSYDAFSLGKAVVTMPSEFHRGRFTFGCYRKMGIDDCVVNSPEEYIRLAVKIAADKDYRENLQRRITEVSEVLFEDPQVPHQLEEFLLEIVENCRGRGK